MQLNSAIFYSHDVNRIRAFYEDIVGLKLDYQDGEDFVSFFFDNGTKLGIKKANRDKEVPGHQAIFVQTDDIQNELQKYQKLGIECYTPYKEMDWGKFFAVLDPDGNKIGYIEE